MQLFDTPNYFYLFLFIFAHRDLSCPKGVAFAAQWLHVYAVMAMRLRRKRNAITPQTRHRCAAMAKRHPCFFGGGEKIMPDGVPIVDFFYLLCIEYIIT